jgi:hypothetical protein
VKCAAQSFHGGARMQWLAWLYTDDKASDGAPLLLLVIISGRLVVVTASRTSFSLPPSLLEAYFDPWMLHACPPFRSLLFASLKSYG